MHMQRCCACRLTTSAAIADRTLLLVVCLHHKRQRLLRAINARVIRCEVDLGALQVATQPNSSKATLHIFLIQDTTQDVAKLCKTLILLWKGRRGKRH